MDAFHTLQKLVFSLTASEKRQVNLLGKMRAGKAGSQHLDLFEFLCSQVGVLPEDSPLQRNLPTTMLRLRNLILDSLRLLHASRDAGTTIATAVADIHNLLEKGQFQLAMRILYLPKQMAWDSARYSQVLALLDLERRLLLHVKVAGLAEALAEVSREEQAAMQRLQVLQKLSNAHERLRLYVRYLAMPNDPSVVQQVLEIAKSAELEDVFALPTYVEQALAVNILGIKFLIQRNTDEAVAIYRRLLQKLNSRPDWVADQAPLLYAICNNFQTACFYSKMSWDAVFRHLTHIPDFNQLAPEVARKFQRMLFHNQLTPALNSGNLDLVKMLIPTIEKWMEEHKKHLGAGEMLPFLHNMAVAQFLMGKHSEANGLVQKILSTPDRNIRIDIRAFAIVLQSVLQFELGEFQLNEYLTRAGKRHLAKQSLAHELELLILKGLERLASSIGKQSQTQVWQSLDVELEKLAQELPGTVPLLGLMEMQLWVQSKLLGRSLTDIFLEKVAANQMEIG